LRPELKSDEEATMSQPASATADAPPAGLPEELLIRNERFASASTVPDALAPRLRACVVTCPDPRVDPAHVLGLELGDAAVVRAAAGRVSPIVLQQLLFLAQTAAAAGQPQEGLELVLMQHTDCGIRHFLDEPHREMLAAFLGCAPDELAGRHPDDPREGIRADIALLAENTLLPDSLAVTGLVYDVGTGRIEVIERRAPLR
jgi:carbonic anhydrase